MKNPFEILKIDENFTFEDELNFLQKKLDEIKKIKSNYDELKSGIVINTFSKYRIGGKSIEESLNERFILELKTDKKFFSKDEYEKMIELIQKQNDNLGHTYDNDEIKLLKSCIGNQILNLRDEELKYNILSTYKKDPNNQENIEKIHDLFIKIKFEEAVINLAKRINIPHIKKIKIDSTFLEELTNNFEYKNLRSAYESIATSEKRNDIIPEKYVKSRNEDPSGILVINPEYVEYLIKNERQYAQKMQAHKDKSISKKTYEEIPVNQNHDHAWGIILEDPKCCIKNDDVDTPIFKGKISVEKLGYFSEQSLFVKRKYQLEQKQKKNISKVAKFGKDIKFNKVQSKNSMREYYYKNVPIKQLYDNIYRVTKTDTEGRIRTDIVFSPITIEQMQNPNMRSFIKNVYFSNYMLDIAKQNGGYAGQLLQSSKGLSISNKYSTDEIASAILFDSNIAGNIVDLRGNEEKRYQNVNKNNFLRILKEKERIKQINE